MCRIKSKIQDFDRGRELEDGEIQTAVSSAVKRAGQAAGEFRKGGREDLALREDQEIEILYGYLPQQLSPEKIESRVRQIIEELSADSPKDPGKVMKTAMARMAGQAQGKEVNEIARKLLC